DKANPGVHPIEWSLVWVALGVGAYLVWSRLEGAWPFGPKEIREEYLTAQQEGQSVETAA
ncbi:amino acid permease, partial [Kitasatospora sp. NPDC049285]